MSPSTYENVLQEVTQSIKAIFDTTARIDERVKSLVEKQNQFDKKLDHCEDMYRNLSERLSIVNMGDKQTKEDQEAFAEEIERLEENVGRIEDSIEKLDRRVKDTEGKTANQESNIKIIIEYVFKAAWIIFVAYVLVRLNLSPPLTP